MIYRTCWTINLFIYVLAAAIIVNELLTGLILKRVQEEMDHIGFSDIRRFTCAYLPSVLMALPPFTDGAFNDERNIKMSTYNLPQLALSGKENAKYETPAFTIKVSRQQRSWVTYRVAHRLERHLSLKQLGKKSCFLEDVGEYDFITLMDAVPT